MMSTSPAASRGSCSTREAMVPRPALLARVCTFGLVDLRPEGVEIEN